MGLLDATVKTLVKFDDKAIERAIGRARSKSMARGAAFVRQAARRDILRRRKRVSEPGQPPSIRASKGGLRDIRFFYDRTKGEAVIGPLKYNRSFDRYPSSAPTLPNLLEFGGTVTNQMEAVNVAESREFIGGYDRIGGDPARRTRARFKTVKAHTVYRRNRFKKPQTIRVRERPFMIAALRQETRKGNVIRAWRGAVI